MKTLGWPLHVIVEERTEEATRQVADRVRELVAGHGGGEVSNAIPKIMRSNPFGPVNNMIGPGGERWVPVHGLLPLSGAAAATEGVQAILECHAGEIARLDIRAGFLYNSVAGACIAVEPLFFWPDSLDLIHSESVEPGFYRKVPKLDQDLEARALVATIRQEIADLLRDLGASHLQLGRCYHYADALEEPALQLVRALKRELDPDDLVNPGVLGL